MPPGVNISNTPGKFGLGVSVPLPALLGRIAKDCSKGLCSAARNLSATKKFEGVSKSLLFRSLGGELFCTAVNKIPGLGQYLQT